MSRKLLSVAFAASLDPRQSPHQAAALRQSVWIVISLSLIVPALAVAQEAEYGPYPMAREASGTSWQPDSTPEEGVHEMIGDWMLMVHGYADGVYDHQGGPRGGTEGFSESMLMAVAQHPLGDGTLGLRGMLSLDPAMGPSGYPLLFQTGETANGVTPLIDRQHPHNLFMELATTYSHPVGDDSSVFAYFGLPGEPALGPTVYMHRFSGMDDPEAPITHHWLDSTHVTFGVATLGCVWQDWKLEGSTFRGREPDQYRWGIETPWFDSLSARLSWNPSKDWSLQTSYGHIVSPEQLTPNVNQDRLTASASFNWRWRGNPAQTTFAWGRIRDTPGNALDAFLLESAIHIRDVHTIFGRVERVSKDDLFDTGPLTGDVFTVNKVSLGYIYEFARWKDSQWGVGAGGSVYPIPAALTPAYGPTPTSFMLFARVKVI
jgi:hypothetical protein